MLQPGQNPDEVDVAEAANQERDAEKDNTELQANREKDVQLSPGEILITHLSITVVVTHGFIWRVFRADKGHNEHDAQVDKGENPEEDAGSDSVHRSALQAVLDRESHTEVALDADRSEEESAVVDGHVEDEARQRTEGVGHVP